VLSLLVRLFNVAISWGWRADNPARGNKRYHETSSERFLSPAELNRLCEALENHPERRSVNAIGLLMLTGARRSEVLKATWSQFDLEVGAWTKPGATTKTKTEHRVPLSAPALQLLTDMKAVSKGEYLFPGNLPDQPLKDIKRTWASVCGAAELEGVRLHDLRHTFASLLASSGLSLPIISKLLGHTMVSTTMRYAKLYDDPLREATERVGAVVAGQGKQAEVVRIKTG
jgi:integrase